MPRLRVLPDEKKDRQLVGAIRQRCTLLAVSDTEAVAAALGVSKPTARDRLSHPEAIRLGELRKLARVLTYPTAGADPRRVGRRERGDRL